MMKSSKKEIKCYVTLNLLGMDGEQVFCVPVVDFKPTFDPKDTTGLGWFTVDVEEGKLIDNWGGYWDIDCEKWLKTGSDCLAFSGEVSSVDEVYEVLENQAKELLMKLIVLNAFIEKLKGGAV